MIQTYAPVLMFLILGALLGCLLILAGALLGPRKPSVAKLTSYECGFDAFDQARMQFDVRYYLITILFLVFDLEMVFLFPWAVVFKDLSTLGFWTGLLFLAWLTVGFIYEWKKGALEWE